MAERTVRGKAIGALLWLLATIPLASAMPPVEAERGQIVSGQISVHRHPNASGGTFIEAQKDTTMEFAVNAPNPMQVRVIPIFWRNSLREQPRFFPYPLPTLFGPDAVVALGNRFYFTAPASGQIGVVDAASGQIVGSVKLGGYLTDLVADEKRQRLLVADAWNGRIVVIDAKTLKATAETKVPQVWSLALTPDDKLVAVSRSERQLLVLDAETMKPLQKSLCQSHQHKFL
jgi:DNA-binding beta-propeller fold protein YncE